METKIKLNTFCKLLATCCYLGYTPIAPGTLTSAVMLTILYMLPSFSIFTFFIILNLLFFAGTIVAEKVSIDTKTKDPSFIVIDEWFGMWLAVFAAPKSIPLYLLAFTLFRILDIIKPGPIAKIEKNINGGLGIMLDDAAAGLLTCIAMQIACIFLS